MVAAAALRSGRQRGRGGRLFSARAGAGSIGGGNAAAPAGAGQPGPGRAAAREPAAARSAAVSRRRADDQGNCRGDGLESAHGDDAHSRRENPLWHADARAGGDARRVPGNLPQQPPGRARQQPGARGQGIRRIYGKFRQFACGNNGQPVGGHLKFIL
ncbi:hypothetical protein ADN00_02030 [Ornatilinea apprima]|uniref:Uncharacterized protein n=1 Tax=Ornatilinea apprima TaxID=1134406 RepID=A0A0P6XBE7_9CHLR|nr:hypothetical protein ADN00_02030 [Ornatilinea apprima]